MSTNSARATRKRARLDEQAVQAIADGGDVDLVLKDDALAELGTRRDEEFWFDDGTIVLVARDVEFRVYSGILASESPVFKDLFSQPNPTRLVSIHGLPDIPCPVVTLTDHPDDLRHILRIVYMTHAGGRLYDAKSPSFDAISASIRLGHKYQMMELYDESVAYLKDHFTDDFDTWANQPDWFPPGWKHAEAIGVVNLARLIGEPCLLPTALLACIELEDELVDGYTRSDGSQESLTLEDLKLCIAAKTRLREAAVVALFRTLEPVVSAACKNAEKGGCRVALRTAIYNLHATVNVWIGGCIFQPYLDCVKDGKVNVCSRCSALLDARCIYERLHIWNRLPELVGIAAPGWGMPAEQA
ncbi:hypothetical protein K466DRAFT_521388 [Polyporus arcularius HHB13444]|uniref:BTB domain-containing protein n=1 Tax=Polyporus arcularius HHB13444 TaxID=1314778 RepID=A0A5C3PFW2_9APHY|nr:hypothetical protein K466DRAFT_521388 [Polyporus arcularius HHB13444]